MNNKITITVGIPLYNDHDRLFRMLSSVLTQTSIPDEIVIVDDCSDCSYDDVLNMFDSKLNIKYIRLHDNKGCGYVRQHILENTVTDYLMYVDSDDVLCDNFWIQNIRCYADDNQADVFVPQFWEQLEDKTTRLVSGLETQPWCHGKAYNVSFLKNNKILFPDVRTNEDVGFNGIIFWVSNNIEYVNYPVYLWLYSKTSITRYGDYSSEKFEEYTKACQYTIDWLRRNRDAVQSSNCALQYAMAHFCSILNQKRRNAKEYSNNVSIFKRFIRENELDLLLSNGLFTGRHQSIQELMDFYNKFMAAYSYGYGKPLSIDDTLWDFVERMNKEESSGR